MSGAWKPIRELLSLFRAAFEKWQGDNAPRLAAALSYYTIFSLAPLLVIVVVIAGSLFGQEAAQGQIVRQIEGVVGSRVATAVQTIIDNADQPGAGLAAVFSFGAILFGATNMFAQLQQAINQVWDYEKEIEGGIKMALKERLVAFLMVLTIGALLVLSFLAETVLTLVGTFLQSLLPDFFPTIQLVNQAFSFGIITLLFSLIYKFLPEVDVAWRDVIPGAVLAATLLGFARYVLNIYLSRSGAVSAYGAAGSVIVLLLWIYFAAQILLYGAEFGEVYANKYGSRSKRVGRSKEQGTPERSDGRIAQGR